MDEPGTNHRWPRILLVRLSAIGDVVQALPMACAIKEKFPHSLLAWVVEALAAPLLEGHEAIDEVITLRRGWLKSPQTVRQLHRRLRSMEFQIAIDAQGLTKAAVVAWLSGAPRRIGFGDPWGRELARWFSTELVDTRLSHAVDRNLELLQPLGIHRPTVQFRIDDQPADRQAAETLIGQAGLAGGFVMVHPGASWPSKLWPADRYGAVAAYLGRTYGLATLVLWGNQKQRAVAQELVAHAGASARLAPRMTLTQLAALARRSRLFIASDTGPLHLAAAVGTPCVGLYGPWPAEKHGPYGPQHIALQKMSFQGSTRQRRKAPPKFMEAISVQMLCTACDQILHRESQKAG